MSPVMERIGKLREQDSKVKVIFLLHVVPRSTDISLYFSNGSVSAVASSDGDLDIEFFDS